MSSDSMGENTVHPPATHWEAKGSTRIRKLMAAKRPRKVRTLTHSHRFCRFRVTNDVANQNTHAVAGLADSQYSTVIRAV